MVQPTTPGAVKPLTRHRIAPALLLTLCLLLPAPAHAAKDGDEVIAQFDDAQNRALDQRFIYDLITQEPGKEPRIIKMDVRVKGTHMRRTDFLAPGDVKGMKALVQSKTKMYIYLPAYRKVRRLARHVEKQSFMGTTFSQNEFTMATYADVFKGKILKETKTHWTVEGLPRDPENAPIPRIEFDIRKDLHLASEIRYFNKQGNKIKTETRTGYTCKPTDNGQVCNFAEAKMVSHVRNGTWSKFVRTKWEVNTGVSDTYFSLRVLQRGR